MVIRTEKKQEKLTVFLTDKKNVQRFVKIYCEIMCSDIISKNLKNKINKKNFNIPIYTTAIYAVIFLSVIITNKKKKWSFLRRFFRCQYLLLLCFAAENDVCKKKFKKKKWLKMVMAK